MLQVITSKKPAIQNYNIIGVGLLYRYGYFTQSLSIFGDQIASYTRKNSPSAINTIRDEMATG